MEGPDDPYHRAEQPNVNRRAADGAHNARVPLKFYGFKHYLAFHRVSKYFFFVIIVSQPG